MSFLRKKFVLSIVTAAALTLAACESSEERAEGHYIAAQELVEAGDVDRALVELRNVFKLNGNHREARLLYASLERERGNISQAFSQLLRVAEQYPDDLDALQGVSEIAITNFDWTTAERHVPRALEIAPDSLPLRAMSALLQYRTAFAAEDSAQVAQTVSNAQAVLNEDEEQVFARHVIINDHLAKDRLSSALENIDIAITQTPEDLRLHETKLRVLTSLRESDNVGAHLEAMVPMFPDNERVRNMLISWYIQEKRFDAAEDFLRDLAAKASGNNQRDILVTIIQILRETQGEEAATAEIRKQIDTGTDVVFFESMLAALQFDAGEQDQAIAAMRKIVDGITGEDLTEDVQNAKVALARMLRGQNDNVGARAHIEDILAVNTGHVEALQMKAAWQIEDDQIGEAIQSLRTALDGDPRNPATLTLMAQAHLRDGSRDLAGERLALAVESSGNAPEETMRYARFLQADDRVDAVEALLTTSLRRNPGNLDLLRALGTLYLQREDWPRAQDVINQVSQQSNQAASSVEVSLRAMLLLRQNKTDEGISFLQDLIDTGDASPDAAALVLQAYMNSGRLEEAKGYLARVQQDYPDVPNLKGLEAALLVTEGKLDEAEAILRDLVTNHGPNESYVRSLFLLLGQNGRAEEADALLDEQIASIGPSASTLRAIKAGRLETKGDIEGAISIYEDLYEQQPESTLLANNLASLLTSQRDDEASLERASVVARRLRGTENPALQDTYGWIQYRRGNIEEALEYLEPAARGLPDDVLVQVHLGLAYAANDRSVEALETLTRAMDMSPNEELPQVKKARETLLALQAEPASESSDN
ncbi:MAG: tetratricopeptide repeat protein [Litoreibacter sp.]